MILIYCRGWVEARFVESEFYQGRDPTTCSNCREKGHVAKKCPNQDSQQDRRRSQKFEGVSPAQSPRRSLRGSREENKISEERLPESPKMKGDAYRKSA